MVELGRPAALTDMLAAGPPKSAAGRRTLTCPGPSMTCWSPTWVGWVRQSVSATASSTRPANRHGAWAATLLRDRARIAPGVVPPVTAGIGEVVLTRENESRAARI